mgnify:FL=1
MNIIPTNSTYNSTLLTNNLITLSLYFPFLDVQTVGKSVLGKNLYVIKLGTGKKEVFYSASFHANEWITSVIMMKFIENYCNAYVSNSTIYGYSIRDLFTNVSIYIMPMVNPDGVDLVTGNISNSSSIYKKVQNIAQSYPDIPFPTRMEG